MELVSGSSTPKSGSQQATNISNDNEDRWKNVDLGVIQTVLNSLLINISDRLSGILTILSSVMISIADTASDFAVAFYLFSSGHYIWGWVVVIIDYVPSWQLAAHNCFSSKWRKVKSIKEKLITFLILLMSPLSLALFHLRWLMKFESADQDNFDYLHHNARMSQILTGSFESPAQIVILLVLWANNKMDHPFADTTDCVVDSQGRNLCLGILPGILSLMLSSVSVLKGCLEVSEGRSWREKIQTLIYAACNMSFRIPSMSLAIIFFNE